MLNFSQQPSIIPDQVAQQLSNNAALSNVSDQTNSVGADKKKSLDHTSPEFQSPIESSTHSQSSKIEVKEASHNRLDQLLINFGKFKRTVQSMFLPKTTNGKATHTMSGALNQEIKATKQEISRFDNHQKVVSTLKDVTDGRIFTSEKKIIDGIPMTVFSKGQQNVAINLNTTIQELESFVKSGQALQEKGLVPKDSKLSEMILKSSEDLNFLTQLNRQVGGNQEAFPSPPTDKAPLPPPPSDKAPLPPPPSDKAPPPPRAKIDYKNIQEILKNPLPADKRIVLKNGQLQIVSRGLAKQFIGLNKQNGIETEALKTILYTLKMDADNKTQNEVLDLYEKALDIHGVHNKLTTSAPDPELKELMNNVLIAVNKPTSEDVKIKLKTELQAIASKFSDQPDEINKKSIELFINSIKSEPNDKINTFLANGYRNIPHLRTQLLPNLLIAYKEGTPAEKENIVNFFIEVLRNNCSIPNQNCKITIKNEDGQSVVVSEKAQFIQIFQELVSLSSDQKNHKTLNDLLADQLSGNDQVSNNAAQPIKEIFKIENATAQQIATDLGAITEEVFLTVNLSEMDNLSWGKRPLEAPTLLNLVNFSTDISTFVVDQILSQNDLKSAEIVYNKFLDSAYLLLDKNNHCAAMSILSALNTSAIYRLFKDDEQLTSKKERISQALSSDNSYQNYRGLMEKALSAGKKEVPFLGTFLTDATFSYDTLSGSAKSQLNVMENISNFKSVLNKSQESINNHPAGEGSNTQVSLKNQINEVNNKNRLRLEQNLTDKAAVLAQQQSVAGVHFDQKKYIDSRSNLEGVNTMLFERSMSLKPKSQAESATTTLLNYHSIKEMLGQEISKTQRLVLVDGELALKKKGISDKKSIHSDALKSILHTLSVKGEHNLKPQSEINNLLDQLMKIPGAKSKIESDENLKNLKEKIEQLQPQKTDETIKSINGQLTLIVNTHGENAPEKIVEHFTNTLKEGKNSKFAGTLAASYRSDEHLRSHLLPQVVLACREGNAIEQKNLLNFSINLLKENFSIPNQTSQIKQKDIHGTPVELNELEEFKHLFNELSNLPPNETIKNELDQLKALISLRLGESGHTENVENAAVLQKFDIRTATAKQLASDIGAYIENSFSSINLSDLDDKEIQAGTSITNHIDNINKLTAFVQKEVLFQDDIVASKQVYEKFLKSAEILVDNKNFEAAMTLYSTLNSTGISRLSLGSDPVSQAILKKLDTKLSMDKNSAVLKEEIENAYFLKEKVIPYLAMYTKEIVFINDGNKNTEALFEKLNLVNKVKSQLKASQISIINDREKGSELKTSLINTILNPKEFDVPQKIIDKLTNSAKLKVPENLTQEEENNFIQEYINSKSLEEVLWDRSNSLRPK